MKRFSKFKIYLVSGTTVTCGPLKKPKTVEEFMSENWPNTNTTWLGSDGEAAIPHHAVCLVEGIDDHDK